MGVSTSHHGACVGRLEREEGEGGRGMFGIESSSYCRVCDSTTAPVDKPYAS